ncbi:MAG: hypothetical protein IJ010_01155 [Ruminococcus sp.]|nr:hypothetical protein [Ruminococcus sp.]
MSGLYELSFFFIIYAILGWCLEVLYEAVDQGKFVNRGFLNGPYCPIYGFGVLIVIGVLTPIKENLIVLYIGSVLLTSLLEFITGFVLEKIFYQKWWDYSDIPFNLKGYICLKFSLLWGVACVGVMRLIHPAIEGIVRWIPHTLGIIILIILFTGFISDIVITVLGIKNIKKNLRLLENISAEMRKISDFSGEKLYDAVSEIRKKSDELSEKTENHKLKLEELKERYKNTIEKRGFVSRRIEKAFPRLKIYSGKSLKELIAELKDERKNKKN